MAIYHLSVKTGSRGGGQSALAKALYNEREGKYERDSEELEYKESGNMPEWAEDDPRQYWAAADQNERANGRLYREVEFALPVELDDRQQRELARSFAAELTGEERLPYTMAIHRGGEDGGNPHVHLMFSERTNDGIERSAEQWFKRANKANPEKGGAMKTRSTMPREWLADTRELWADRANEALERAGRPERITEVSLKEQYFEAAENGDEREMARLNREPGVHIGPHNIARIENQEQIDRVEDWQDANLRGEIGRIEALYDFVDAKIDDLTARMAEVVEKVKEALTPEIERSERGGGIPDR